MESSEADPLMIRLRTLGALRLVRVDGGAETVLLPVGKPAALIAYLLCQHRRTAAREHLVDLFWSESDPERGRHSLRQALTAIRRQLGEDAISADAAQVALTAQVSFDRDELLAAAQAGDAESAISLYDGDFLSTFAAPGTLEFELWTHAEAQSLRETLLSCIPDWVRAAQAAQRFDDAVRYCRHGLNIQPDRESLWRLLLETHVLAGAFPLARAEAERLRAELEAAGRSPEPATRAMLRRMDGARAVPAADAESQALHTELIGREEAFALLLSVWQAVGTGSTTLVRLCGGAGIGKSRLLDELAARLRVLGALVLRSRGRQGERSLPFALAGDVAAAAGSAPGALAVAPGVAAALLGLHPSLGGHFPGVTPDGGDDSDAVRRRGAALAELLSVVAEERACAVLVDDFHWSDAASSAVIDIALARTRGRVLFVLATREQPDPTQEEHHVLMLRPLMPSEVEALVASIARLPDEPWVAEWTQFLALSSRGVPLSVLHLISDAIERGLLARNGGEFRTPDPSRLLAAAANETGMRLRLERLPAQTQQLLAVLAAAGTPLTIQMLASALDVGRAVVEQLTRTLESVGFVRASENGVELGHDLVGEEIASVVPAAMRRDAARGLGRAKVRAGLHAASDFRQAARLLREGDDWESFEAVAIGWLHLKRPQWQPPSKRLRDLMGDAIAPEEVARLLSRLPTYLRWSPRRRAIGGASLVTLAVIGVLAGWMMWRPSAGTHLALLTEPMSDTAGIFTVAPAVEIRGATGARADASVDVHVEVVKTGGDATLAGRTLVRAVHGVARFDSIWFSPVPDDRFDWQLKFSAPGLPPVLSVRYGQGAPAHLRILSGRLHEQVLDAAQPMVLVAPGDSIVGSLLLGFRTNWGAASVMLGLAPSWEERRAAVRTVSAMPTPVANGRRVVRVALRAPRSPGGYYILLMMAAEPDPKWTFSGTNWTMGAPRWNDGNDAADLDHAALQQARDSGFVRMKQLRRDYGGPTRLAEQAVAAAVVYVEVRRQD
jgi:DNA-binding SARP family transcriptional activator